MSDETLTLAEILREAHQAGASDVHLTVDRPPVFRVDGRMRSSPRDPLSAEALKALLDAALSPTHRAIFEETNELCISMLLPEIGFSRLNVYTHLGRPEASIRLGSREVPDLDELTVPPLLSEMCRRPHGLILVTGPTGVGKTTTLNGLVGRINAEECKKIVTIEDPVEFVHPRGRSIVVQQEIGLDAPSFDAAILHALRQDPDIIVIGEMRDLSTIRAALTAAETGHLVIATLHTTTASGTISRIVDVFPAGQQTQVRVQLATVLQAVLTQKLLPRADGEGRLLVYDFLVVTKAVRNLIREDKTHQLGTVIDTGRGRGMRSMDRMIKAAYLAGEITYETAQASMNDTRTLKERPA